MLALQKIMQANLRPRASAENLHHAMEAAFLDSSFGDLDRDIQIGRERIARLYPKTMTQQGWIV